MAEAAHSPAEVKDVAVIGAGLAGLAAAKGFVQGGLSVALNGPPNSSGPGRTVALFGPSLDMMSSFGLREEIEKQGAPLKALRIVDDTGSLFAPRPVDFLSSEIGLETFGWNIENRSLADLLARSITDEKGIVRHVSLVRKLSWTETGVAVHGQAGDAVTARLAVAADGRQSPTRRAAGIEVRAHAYPQSAMTMLLRHTRPHDDVSTEFHTREGPFTLVPLPASAAAANRMSLVWLMSPAEARRRAALGDGALAREIEKQSRGLIGRVEIEGDRGVFPMTRQTAIRMHGRRVALIGDAAHVYPPIGAQGLNLGLRDAATLVKIAIEARRRGDDIGGARTLAEYQLKRGPDIGLRTLAVNGLNASLLTNFPPIDAARAFGLTAIRVLPPLRRRMMREGVAPMFAKH